MLKMPGILRKSQIWLNRLFQSSGWKEDKYLKELFILAVLTLSVLIIIVQVFKPPPLQFPFEYNSIISIEGKLLSDSRKIKGHNSFYSVKITKAHSKYSISAEAKGVVKIIAPGDALLKGSYALIEFKVFPDIKLLKEKSGSADNPVLLLNAWKVSGMVQPDMVSARKIILDYVLESIAVVETSNGFLSALLTGNRDALDKTAQENIRKAGCSHVLALSGMHLGIIAALVLMLVKPLAGTKKAIICANIFSLFYLFLAGTSPSLLRSFIFFLLVSISKLSGRKIDLRKLIVLCFILTSFVSPDDTGELSFQFSFMAAAGIIFTAEFLYRKLLCRIPPFLALPLSCSLAAQLPAALLSGMVFSVVYPAGIIASLVLTPLVALLMWSAVPAVLWVMLAGRPHRVVIALLDLQSDIIGKTAYIFSGIPPINVNSYILALLFLLNVFIITSALYRGRSRFLWKRYR